MPGPRALLPLIGETTQAQAAIAVYPQTFNRAYLEQMRRKLGLQEAREGDEASIAALLALLASEHVDYPVFWRRLSLAIATDHMAPVRDLFVDPSALDAWLLSLQKHLAQDGKAQNPDLMLKTNPRFVLRTHLAEYAIQDAKLQHFETLQALHEVLAHPYDEHPDQDAWAGLPPDWANTLTLSCSS